MAIRFVNKPKPLQQTIDEKVKALGKEVADTVDKEVVEGLAAPAKQQAAPAEGKGKAGKKFSLQSKSPEAAGPEDLQGFKILPKMNFSVKDEESKFLVHKTKPGIWYEVVSYDEYATTPVLKLRSPGGLTFDSAPDITTDKKYVMIVGPGDIPKPPDALLKKIRFSGEAG